MKITIRRSGGYGEGHITEAGGEAYGIVELTNSPELDNDAATVAYVESKKNDTTVERYAIGELAVEHLPAFVGDVISVEGTGEINLVPTGVSQDSSHVKVSVNNKGQITGGGSYLEADIPDLPFSKLINKPTTLAEYGISGLLSPEGGVFTGTLKSTYPDHRDSFATLKFLKDHSGPSFNIRIGGIVYRGTLETPAGFLRCNGAEVSKRLYQDLYNVIGDSFSPFTYVAFGGEGGSPWNQQYGFNDVQTNTTLSWTANTALPIPITRHQLIVTDHKVFVLGGANSTGHLDTIYSCTINPVTNNLSAWTLVGNLPIPVSEAQAIVFNNNVYLIGGRNANGFINTVFNCPIDENGDLGEWAIHSTLPFPVAFAQATLTSNRLYLLGGENDTGNLNTVLYTEINEDGSSFLENWEEGPTLPINLTKSCVALTNNRVHLLGGMTTTTAIVNTYNAPIDSDGVIGDWVSGPNLTVATNSGQAILSKNVIYFIATSTLRLILNASGMITTQSTTTATPGSVSSSAKVNRQIFATANRFYIVGGESTTAAPYNQVHSAPFLGGSNIYKYAAPINKINSGNGKPWKYSYNRNSYNRGGFSSWTLNQISAYGPNRFTRSLVTKNTVYLIGGGTINSPSLLEIPLTDGGSPGPILLSNLTIPKVRSHEVLMGRNCVYIVGGFDITAGTIGNKVYKLPINEEGKLTTVGLTELISLPTNTQNHSAIITKDKILVIGGDDGLAAKNIIYYTDIDENGDLGEWKVSTVTLPTPVTRASLAVVKNNLYLIGGGDTPTFGGTTIVYKTTIDRNGLIGEWTTVTPLPTSRRNAQVIVTDEKIYLLGGADDDNTATNTVLIGNLDTNGDIVDWELSPNQLPIETSAHDVAIVKGSLLLFAGNANVNSYYSTYIDDGLNDYTPFFTETSYYDLHKDVFNLPNISSYDNTRIPYIKY